jgi:hypothetical protein
MRRKRGAGHRTKTSKPGRHRVGSIGLLDARTFMPLLWILFRMEYSEHQYDVCFDAIQDAMRKPVNRPTSDLELKSLHCQWTDRDRFRCRFNGDQKLAGKRSINAAVMGCFDP